MHTKDSNLDAKKAIGLLFFMCPVHIMLNTALYMCIAFLYSYFHFDFLFNHSILNFCNTISHINIALRAYFQNSSSFGVTNRI